MFIFSCLKRESTKDKLDEKKIDAKRAVCVRKWKTRGRINDFVYLPRHVVYKVIEVFPRSLDDLYRDIVVINLTNRHYQNTYVLDTNFANRYRVTIIAAPYII